MNVQMVAEKQESTYKIQFLIEIFPKKRIFGQNLFTEIQISVPMENSNFDWKYVSKNISENWDLRSKT